MGKVSIGIGDISGRSRSNFMTKMIMPLTQMSILQVQPTSQAPDPIMPAVTHTAGPETVEQPEAQRPSSRPVKVPQRLIEQC